MAGTAGTKELVEELVTLDAADGRAEGRGPGRGLYSTHFSPCRQVMMYREEEDRGGLESSRGVSLFSVIQEVSYLSTCK